MKQEFKKNRLLLTVSIPSYENLPSNPTNAMKMIRFFKILNISFNVLCVYNNCSFVKKCGLF